MTNIPAISGGVGRPDAREIHLLIEGIARALVDDPEDVSVEALERGESTTLRLHVSDRDVGKIIGKQGRTAHSLRTILSAVSMKYHHRYALDIVERNFAGDTLGFEGNRLHD
jgi:uncharacterized protein